MSGPVILVLVIVVYIATLTEVIVAEVQMHQMVCLRDTGTALMGLMLGVSHRRWLMIALETSSTEIGLLE